MRKLRIALMAAAGTVASFFIGSIVTFEMQIPEIITKTVEVITPPPERIEVTRVAMVKALEGKLEITSASMKLEKYVPSGTCNSFLWEDCIVMIVTGKVNAGFDWGTFSSDDITTTGDVVTVNLGTPKIHDVVIDHTRTKVLNQTDGLLVINPDKSLQMRTLAKTVTQLRKDACHNDLLKFAALEADKRVGDNLRLFLQQAGDVRTVKVVYDIPDCKTVL